MFARPCGSVFEEADGANMNSIPCHKAHKYQLALSVYPFAWKCITFIIHFLLPQLFCKFLYKNLYTCSQKLAPLILNFHWPPFEI